MTHPLDLSESVKRHAGNGRAAIIAVAILLTSCGREHAMQAPRAEGEYGLEAALSGPSIGPSRVPPSAPSGGTVVTDLSERTPSDAVAPQIAYTYTVRYDLGRRTPAAVQEKHLALCRDLGQSRCRVLRSSTSAEDGAGWAEDQTELLIDARFATGFNGRLDAIAEKGGATLRHRQTSAEDVTAEVIDVDARVRAKQALADRLLSLIRSGNGRVGDLVQAERAYAETQGELDAARGKAADLRRRVRMSQVSITYLHHGSGGMFSPVRRSLGWAGETLAGSLAALVTFAVASAPWLLVLAALLWLWRKLGGRWPLLGRRRPPA